METSPPLAGSEIKALTTTDGQTEYKPLVPPSPPEPPAESDQPTREEAVQYAMQVGASRRQAFRMFAAMRPLKFLNRRVTGGVTLVAQATSIEQLERTQKGMQKLMKDTSLDARVRVSAGAVVAQCAMAIARHGESMMQAAEAIERSEDGQSESSKSPVVAVNIQNNTFTPPVAAPRKVPITVAAKNGED